MKSHALKSFSPEAMQEIKDMAEFCDKGLIFYSDSIINLFYMYIAKSLLHKDEISLENSDIFSFMQVKRLLELLQNELNKNNG
ncbi:hypothetical protein CQ046_10950 [Chryseobacterium sp. MYb7]|uniref:hypothetical protein n=1 Tax=Chryseobacterium sp. MYb7 TaxID=1827290 RepID=UPI000D00408D|nr:hypothetical protein [Chryseobacterium sp. MYb7]PRB03065.1 hypothetical protein CQ046_10950 [Chryseobacterium sp. MYb7]